MCCVDHRGLAALDSKRRSRLAVSRPHTLDMLGGRSAALSPRVPRTIPHASREVNTADMQAFAHLLFAGPGIMMH